MKTLVKILIGIVLLFMLYALLRQLLGMVIGLVIIVAFAGIVIAAIGYLLRDKKPEKEALYVHPRMDSDAEKRAERALKEMEKRHKQG